MIHMAHGFPEIIHKAPVRSDFEGIFAARPLVPFSAEVLAFLRYLSSALLLDRATKEYPDIVSFAFWCRNASLQAMKKAYSAQQLSLGRGVVFHIAPSNVPVNFAYSLAAGLLAGNANIVRVPTRDFPQVKIICSRFQQLLEKEEFRHLRDHILLIRYEKSDEVTDFFSAHCDVRVIWGGDQTIADIRRSPLPARSFDLTFADRYSFCLINADIYPGDADPARIAEDFYNDTYLFDQNACTAPHLVVWVGSMNSVKKAQELFWNSLRSVVADKYDLQPVSAVDKLSDAFRFAASSKECRICKMDDNLIIRIQLNQLKQGLEEASSRCGFFYEFVANGLDEIVPIVNRKFQTLAYYGFEPSEFVSFVKKHNLTGIDRIVPVGRTLDFSLTWDGYDLISLLSRRIQLS